MERSPETDEELAEAAAGGDADAFAALYARYGTPICDFASRLTRSRDDGADVTQLTFERVWRNLGRRRADKRFKPWLFAIAHNTAMEVLRKRRPTVSVDDEEAGVFAVLASPAEDVSELERREIAHDVWAAAAALGPTEYSVLHHQLRSGMGPEEIAAATGMKAGAVYTALSRARSSLEEAFIALQLVRRGRRDCPRLRAVLGEDAPEVFDRSTRRAIREHIGECEICDANSRRFVAPAELFGALVPVAAPPTFARISEREARPRQRVRRRTRGRPLATGAGLVAVIAAGAVAAGLAGGGGGGDATAPRDPTRIVSLTHRWASPRRSGSWKSSGREPSTPTGATRRRRVSPATRFCGRRTPAHSRPSVGRCPRKLRQREATNWVRANGGSCCGPSTGRGTGPARRASVLS